MSVTAMSWAWDQAIRPHQKLVLVAYCDHASDDGTSIWPSIGSIALKTGYSRRRVQQITRELEEMGLLIAEGSMQISGRADREVNAFRVPLQRGEKVSPRSPNGAKSFHPVSPYGVKPDSPRNALRGEAGFTQAVIDDDNSSRENHHPAQSKEGRTARLFAAATGRELTGSDLRELSRMLQSASEEEVEAGILLSLVRRGVADRDAMPIRSLKYFSSAIKELIGVDPEYFRYLRDKSVAMALVPAGVVGGQTEESTE